VVYTVAHEARHLWQYRQGSSWRSKGRYSGGPERAAQEADASDYAYLMLSRFMGER
jgi:hypothetical protein